MAEINIDISFHIENLTNSLRSSIQRLMNLVSIGLSNFKVPQDEITKLPDSSMGFKYSTSEQWDQDKAKEQWVNWILLNGFRDITESLNYFLEEIQFVLSYCNLLKIHGGKGNISGKEYNILINDRKKEFHKFGFTNKLDYLKDEYGFKINQQINIFINSIIKARNCIVHRNGVVNKIDCNKNSILEIQYFELKLILKSNGNEKEVIPPFDADKNDELIVRQEISIKKFKIGKRILLNSKEFSYICWTTYIFGEESKKLLKIYIDDIS